MANNPVSNLLPLGIGIIVLVIVCALGAAIFTSMDNSAGHYNTLVSAETKVL